MIDIYYYVECMNLFLVEYRKQQDAKVLKTGTYTNSGHSLIALSPDATAIAIAYNVHISIYNTLTTDCQQVITDAHTGER